MSVRETAPEWQNSWTFGIVVLLCGRNCHGEDRTADQSSPQLPILISSSSQIAGDMWLLSQPERIHFLHLEGRLHKHTFYRRKK
jgi:hypothetical protein